MAHGLSRCEDPGSPVSYIRALHVQGLPSNFVDCRRGSTLPMPGPRTRTVSLGGGMISVVAGRNSQPDAMDDGSCQKRP